MQDTIIKQHSKASENIVKLMLHTWIFVTERQKNQFQGSWSIFSQPHTNMTALTVTILIVLRIPITI